MGGWNSTEVASAEDPTCPEAPLTKCTSLHQQLQKKKKAKCRIPSVWKYPKMPFPYRDNHKTQERGEKGKKQLSLFAMFSNYQN